ncbi:MAG: heavy-metal-associated domain-containing protein [Betaproteobacteria bacterium]|nr:heavy-metal-associated domain-containing protein [Betaproteobacteria bacterium]
MLTLTIPDMTCGGCLAGIERVVKKVDAGATVTADLPTHRVDIQSGASAPALIAAIEGAGFHPQAV